MAREGVRLNAYQDVGGVWTIGYGHTPAFKGGKITKQDAETLLEADLAKFEKAVDDAITMPMTQNQFDAMVSLAFNIGAGAFANSSVVRFFNRGKIRDASDAFLLWKFAAGKPVLLGRRQQEREQFLSGSPPAFDPDDDRAMQVGAPAPFNLFAWLKSVFTTKPTE